MNSVCIFKSGSCESLIGCGLVLDSSLLSCLLLFVDRSSKISVLNLDGSIPMIGWQSPVPQSHNEVA